MDVICQTRRSRTRRQSIGKRISLSPRDIEIFGLLDRYRYLRSSFICAFFPDADRTGLVKRLGDLFHEGYLDRPVQQYQYANARYQPAVYELNDRSAAVLQELGHGLERRRTSVTRHFAHAVMISDILASIELGTRQAPLRFIPASEIVARAPDSADDTPMELRASILYEARTLEVTIVPDALFGLEYQNVKGNAYRFFALEADRNTMPVSRARLEQSSYLRKLLAYREVLAREIHRRRLGIPNLFILTVTQSDAHKRNLMQLLKKMTGGKGSTAFMFKTMGSLGDAMKAPLPTPHMLFEPWERQGHSPFCIAKQ